MTKKYPLSDLVTDTAYDNVLHADVLVIGGSVAGCWSALTARKLGAEVILVEKSYVGTAGVVATATGGAAYTLPGQTERNQRLIYSRHKAAAGIDDLAFIERVYNYSYTIALKLKNIGFQSSFGTPSLTGEERLLAFHGPYALHFLREKLLEAGVRILDFSPAIELLKNDSGVAGAAGINTRSSDTWLVRARSTILATGGNAFRSGAMGTHDITGDGHLMAAEAGAVFSGMEYSGHYGISPQGSPTTKGFWYGSATFYDGNGRELPENGWESVARVAKAIMETGGAYACMNQGGPLLAEFARSVSSIYEHFNKIGVDPFTEKFPLELRYEGLIRATGGILVNDHAETNVPGLFAAGDVTDRTKLTGAAMSGAGPAIAWCVVSAEWAANAAVVYANETGKKETKTQALGSLGIRPIKKSDFTPASIILSGVQAEILPIEKNVFRTLNGINSSLKSLDVLWANAREGLGAGVANLLQSRESAAMLASARWIYTAAQTRRETRGLHRLVEYPEQDPAQLDRIIVSGLDNISIQRISLHQSV